ncbi:hypothetical protein NKH18_43940 [Streptomyces sp. M10(2022)]
MLVLLSGSMPMVVANALITVVSTVIATELHSRISFRSERRGWSVHLQSGLTVAVSYVFTTGALLILHAVHSAPSALVEQGVYLSASALAGSGGSRCCESWYSPSPSPSPSRPSAGRLWPWLPNVTGVVCHSPAAASAHAR